MKSNLATLVLHDTRLQLRYGIFAAYAVVVAIYVGGTALGGSAAAELGTGLHHLYRPSSAWLLLPRRAHDARAIRRRSHRTGNNAAFAARLSGFEGADPHGARAGRLHRALSRARRRQCRAPALHRRPDLAPVYRDRRADRAALQDGERLPHGIDRIPDAGYCASLSRAARSVSPLARR